MRIAIDAMGGDNAPQVTVEGAMLAAAEFSDMELSLVGDEAVLAPLLTKHYANIRIVHASERIAADDEPARAVRRKKDASMVVAGRMVKEGEADAMLSAGNTGALMATGLLVIGRMEGIERPGLAPMIPTMDGKGTLAIDLGANVDAAPQHLLQYAIMGSIYRHKVHGIRNPRVGLLNIGTEEMKGNELTKSAYPLLKAASLNFVGNVEARDVLRGVCDVLVCDGFAGNIMLKSLEGAAEAIFFALKEEFTRSFVSKLAAAVLKPGLKKFKNKLDYTEHGGALLLGVNGVCIKGHGSSDEKAIKNAIGQARKALANNLVPAIAAEITRK
ncbi:MAG TPA: phosphate acyltransferase PlsX [Bacilli bacterium]